MKPPYGLCISCGTPLLQPFGFYGCEMCGPCTVGEAAAFGQVSYKCVSCDIHDEVDATKPAPVHCGKSMQLTGKSHP